MDEQHDIAPSPVTVRREHGTLILDFGERLQTAETARLWPQLVLWLAEPETSRLQLELGRIRVFDSSGAVLLAHLREACRKSGRTCEPHGASPALESLMTAAAAPAPAAPAPAPVAELQVIEYLPIVTAELFLTTAGKTHKAVTFIGDMAMAMATALRRPQTVRWRDFKHYFRQCGADALPITALICFLMGVIMAFQAAVQLHVFGADIFVADLVGLSITRELGPLMVAVIGAGRSGAAFAAEIGTMKVGEEVEAMVTMGLDPQRFLVLPKVLALVAALPCLTLLGDLIGIFGGLLIGQLVLGLPALTYLNRTVAGLAMSDVFGGLVKSVVFAMVIAGVGCYRGFRTGTTAQSVGQSTTAAVVIGIFLIIVIDAVFSVLYHVLGV